MPGLADDTPIVTETAARLRRIVEERPRKKEASDHGPAVSVVVCTLGGDGVRDTVDSVVASGARSGLPIEIVVIWQSDDEPPELGPQARIIPVFSAGVANARNRGIVESRGPLVAFADDDEVVDGGWVDAIVSALEGHIAAVFGPVAPRDDRGLPYCRYDGGGTVRFFAGRHIPPWTVGTGGNMAFRREPLLAAGGFDVLFGAGAAARSAEDTEVVLRLLRAGHTLAWTPEMVVYHPSKTETERRASRFPYAYGMGKVIRRHRDPVLAARYLKSIGEAAGRALVARDSRRLREAGATMRGFTTGLVFRATLRSPSSVLREAPEPVEQALDGVRLEPREPTFRPDLHLIYFAGFDRVLHVYANPSARLRDGFVARERIREGFRGSGIPRLLALGETRDALWVVEERLHGHPPRAREVSRWFPEAASWAEGLAAGSRLPVRETAWWHEKSEPVVAAAPASLRSPVAEALELLGDLPSRPLHGDFQPKNILLGPHGSIGVIDWEHAYESGPPGLDLLFLAVMARGEPPDPEALDRLASNRDPDWARLRSCLARAGLGGPDLRPSLLAALAVWAYDEDVRLAAPGMPRAARTYGRLLLELGPRLS